ncbi:hypothetical protein OF83DRAFT_1288190 [Amylostereum chailletii]|nr:hypothetical protein OF83DRAFT_1288190 [Amylostereum chailletii]
MLYKLSSSAPSERLHLPLPVMVRTPPRKKRVRQCSPKIPPEERVRRHTASLAPHLQELLLHVFTDHHTPAVKRTAIRTDRSLKRKLERSVAIPTLSPDSSTVIDPTIVSQPSPPGGGRSPTVSPPPAPAYLTGDPLNATLSDEYPIPLIRSSASSESPRRRSQHLSPSGSPAAL